MEMSEGFPAVVRADAKVLVLGSLPGQRSWSDQEYYAHPQNVFWPIMRELFGIFGDYDQRCALLRQHKIALWDVLSESVRPGSLDADIRLDTAIANDFKALLSECPEIEVIAFNGKSAERLFHRMVPKADYPSVNLHGLPSTSPSYAAMPFKGKLNAWKAGLAPLQANN